MNRRTARLTAAALASIVVLLLAGAFLLRLHFQRRHAATETLFRDQAGPLEPDAYAPPEVADLANIAAWMKAGAAAILVDSEDRQLLAELGDHPSAEWSPQERQRIEALLGELGPALSLLHHGAELSDSSFGLTYGAGPTMPIPSEIGVQLLRASSLLAAESRLALVQGDVEGAVRSARGVERLAAALGHEPILFFAILEEGVSHRYLLLLRSILESGPPEPVLSELASDLRHREALCTSLARAIAFEATGAHGAFEHGTFQGGIGFRMPATLRYLGPLIAARTLEAFLQLVERARAPDALTNLPHERPSRVRPWDLDLLLLPNLTEALARDKATESALELARLAIEANRSALSEGRYPDSLADLGERPPTPSPISGEAPLYERTADGGVLIAYPVAERLWKDRGSDDDRRARLLSWTLPPPS